LISFSGDLNSLLRFGNIIRSCRSQPTSDANDEKIIRALNVMLLSLDHEEEEYVKKLNQHTTNVQNSQSSFPGHALYIERLGGLQNMWRYLLECLSRNSIGASPHVIEIKKLTCQWIQKAFVCFPHRSSMPIQDLSLTYVQANGISQLVECLDMPSCALFAGESLASIVSTDLTGQSFMNHDDLLLHILNLIPCFEPIQQLSLAIVMVHVIRLLPNMMRMLIDAGILSIFSSLLSSPLWNLRVTSINLITNILLGVRHSAVSSSANTQLGDPNKPEDDILTLMTPILKDLLRMDLLSLLSSMIPSAEATLTANPADQIEMCLSSLKLLVILSNYQVTRAAILTNERLFHSICQTLEISVTFLTEYDPSQLSELTEDERTDLLRRDEVADNCAQIILNISQTHFEREKLMIKFSFIDPLFKLTSFYSLFPGFTTGSHGVPTVLVHSLELLSLYGVSPIFGERLESIGAEAVSSLVGNICRVVNVLCYPPNVSSLSNTMVTQQLLNCFISLTYILYHTYVASYSLPPALLMKPSYKRSPSPLNSSHDKAIFMTVAKCEALMKKLAEYLRDMNKSSHASRLIKVLVATPHCDILTILWSYFHQFHVISALKQCVSTIENVINMENAVFALGTLAGCSPYFSWECAILSLRVGTISTSTRGVLSPRETEVMMMAQTRSLNRMDAKKSHSQEEIQSLESHVIIQRDKEAALRRELADMVQTIVIPALSCAREGIRVLGATRLIQLLSTEPDFDLSQVCEQRGIFAFANNIKVSVLSHLPSSLHYLDSSLDYGPGLSPVCH
jgi:hypothetical protein